MFALFLLSFPPAAPSSACCRPFHGRVFPSLPFFCFGPFLALFPPRRILFPPAASGASLSPCPVPCFGVLVRSLPFFLARTCFSLPPGGFPSVSPSLSLMRLCLLLFCGFLPLFPFCAAVVSAVPWRWCGPPPIFPCFPPLFPSRPPSCPGRFSPSPVLLFVWLFPGCYGGLLSCSSGWTLLPFLSLSVLLLPLFFRPRGALGYFPLSLGPFSRFGPILPFRGASASRADRPLPLRGPASSRLAVCPLFCSESASPSSCSCSLPPSFLFPPSLLRCSASLLPSPAGPFTLALPFFFHSRVSFVASLFLLAVPCLRSRHRLSAVPALPPPASPLLVFLWLGPFVSPPLMRVLASSPPSLVLPPPVRPLVSSVDLVPARPPLFRLVSASFPPPAGRLPVPVRFLPMFVFRPRLSPHRLSRPPPLRSYIGFSPVSLAPGYRASPAALLASPALAAFSSPPAFHPLLLACLTGLPFPLPLLLPRGFASCCPLGRLVLPPIPLRPLLACSPPPSWCSRSLCLSCFVRCPRPLCCCLWLDPGPLRARWPYSCVPSLLFDLAVRRRAALRLLPFPPSGVTLRLPPLPPRSFFRFLTLPWPCFHPPPGFRLAHHHFVFYRSLSPAILGWASLATSPEPDWLFTNCSTHPLVWPSPFCGCLWFR